MRRRSRASDGDGGGSMSGCAADNGILAALSVTHDHMSTDLHVLRLRDSVVVAPRRVAIAACVAAGVALAPALPLSAQSKDSLVVPMAAPFSCLDTSATIVPARLDARHLIYVEQETVVGQEDGRVLVAGNPVFVWRDRGNGFDLLARDSLFGMVIDTGAVVRGIP